MNIDRISKKKNAKDAQIVTHVPITTAKKFEALCKANAISKSEALRRCVESLI